MLGRKTYTPEELDNATTAISRQLTAYRKLAETADASALAAFEPLFSNTMTLVLDRLFVHRLRSVTGKDGNALNEVELLAESLMNNDGILRGNNVVKYVPGASVVRLEIGDPIALSITDFDRLSKEFLGEIEAKFVQGAHAR